MDDINLVNIVPSAHFSTSRVSRSMIEVSRDSIYPFAQERTKEATKLREDKRADVYQGLVCGASLSSYASVLP